MEETGSRTSYLVRIDQQTAVGNFADALTVCEEALVKFPGDLEFLDRYGRLLGLNRRNTDAIRFFRQMTSTDPHSGTYHFGLGLALWSQGEMEEAEAELRDALHCAKRVPEAIVPLSHVLIRRGKWAEASALIEEILINESAFGELANGFQSLLLCRRAEIALHDRQPTVARAYLREAVSLPVVPPPAWSLLREQNPKCGALSKLYSVTVQGMTREPMPPMDQPAEFLGHYIVIANDRREILRYIREVEAIAEPDTLTILEAQKKRRVSPCEHRGIVVRLPSMSVAEFPLEWSKS